MIFNIFKYIFSVFFSCKTEFAKRKRIFFKNLYGFKKKQQIKAVKIEDTGIEKRSQKKYRKPAEEKCFQSNHGPTNYSEHFSHVQAVK